MLPEPYPRAPRLRKADQAAATQRHLLDLARDAFTEHGYARTATEEVVHAAGVTRGALYHHFGNKEGLFAAVLADIQQEVGQRIERAAGGSQEPWTRLLAGCSAYLAASLDPAVRQIMLVDAPAVLGWARWRALDAENAMRLLRAILGELMAQGQLPTLPLDALTHLLSGAMNEAALWIAMADDRQAALAEATATLTRLLESLRVVGEEAG